MRAPFQRRPHHSVKVEVLSILTCIDYHGVQGFNNLSLTMSVQILCINKDAGNHMNPYESISNLGWKAENGARGIASLKEMVAFIEQGGRAYTRDAFNNVAWLIVRVSARGNKFVQTVADKRWTDNLLALNECLL